MGGKQKRTLTIYLNPPILSCPKESQVCSHLCQLLWTTQHQLSFSKCIFDKSAIKTLCSNTNKKAARNTAAGKKFKWTEVTEEEMCKYIGLTHYMGILKLPKLRDYWCVKSIFHVPYPQNVMSRDRFLSITWNMHLSDPAEDAANNRKKGTDEYDCLHRIRPLYDSLRVACKAFTTLTKTFLWMSEW